MMQVSIPIRTVGRCQKCVFTLRQNKCELPPRSKHRFSKAPSPHPISVTIVPAGEMSATPVVCNQDYVFQITQGSNVGPCPLNNVPQKLDRKSGRYERGGRGSPWSTNVLKMCKTTMDPNPTRAPSRQGTDPSFHHSVLRLKNTAAAKGQPTARSPGPRTSVTGQALFVHGTSVYAFSFSPSDAVWTR